MSGILLLNIPLALYDLCVQQSRGSLVMGLARLAENMMGVLICRQVVWLNDGRADSPVECSSGGWDVGWLFKPTPPSHLVLPQWMSLGLTENFENFFPHCLCKEEAQNWLEFLTCTSSYLAASSLLTILIWGDSDWIMRAKWRGVNSSLFRHGWYLLTVFHQVNDDLAQSSWLPCFKNSYRHTKTMQGSLHSLS